MNILEQAKKIIKNFVTRNNSNIAVIEPEEAQETATEEIQEHTPVSPATYETVQKFKELQGKLFPVKLHDVWCICDEEQKKLFYITKTNGTISCDCSDFQSTNTYCIHILSALQECRKMKNFNEAIAKRDEKINPEALWLLKLAQTRLTQICSMTRNNATCSNYFSGKLAGIKYCLHLLLRQNRF